MGLRRGAAGEQLKQGLTFEPTLSWDSIMPWAGLNPSGTNGVEPCSAYGAENRGGELVSKLQSD